LVRHGLHPVADAQHWHTKLEHCLRCLVGGVLVHTGVASREDDALESSVHGVVTHPIVRHVAGVNFAEHMGLANTAGNELGDWRAEVKDEDFLVLQGGRRKKDKGPNTVAWVRAWIAGFQSAR